ncbi:MAG: hypothetical protein VXV76_04665 [Candidatus Thermoplasmatota archaeon]|nr:hypothetical protein [Candidatus Thermoplasmatota archaeon]
MTGQDSGNLSDKLNKTKERLNQLSKKVAETTKAMVESTNNSIKSTINEHKEKRQLKKDEKIAQAKIELSSDGLLNDIPAMITLPEFEQERMEITVEQNDTMVTIVEEMQILSERVDDISKRVISINGDLRSNSVVDTEVNQHNIKNELIVNQIISFIGVSVIWFVLLMVADYYSTENSIKVNQNYPLSYYIWSIGTASWVFFLLQKLGNSSPIVDLHPILKTQITLVAGIITFIALVRYGGSTDSMPDIWFWGTAIAVVLILTSSLINSVWQSTKRLISARDEVEIIE